MFTVLIPTAGAPVFLEHQIRLLRRFSAQPLKIVVVNDARPFAHPSNWMDAGAAAAIDDVCSRHSAIVLKAPDQRWWQLPRAPSQRTGDALNFGFSRIRNDSFVAIIDADMIPIASFSFCELLNGSLIAGVPQTRSGLGRTARYLWNGFLLFHTSHLPDTEGIDFGCTRFPRTDTGGKLSRYLRKRPHITVRAIPHLSSGCWRDFTSSSDLPAWLRKFVSNDPANVAGSFFSEVYAGAFFHFRSGANWQGVLGEKADTFTRRYQSFIVSLEGA